jgi:hypothetical protein
MGNNALNKNNYKVAMIDYLSGYSGISHLCTDKELNKHCPHVKHALKDVIDYNDLITMTSDEIQKYE